NFFIKAFFLIQTIPIWNGRDSTKSIMHLIPVVTASLFLTSMHLNEHITFGLALTYCSLIVIYVLGAAYPDLDFCRGFKNGGTSQRIDPTSLRADNYEVHESIQAQRIEASRKSNILVAMGKPM
ncbi:hypothetical protein ACJX0J_039244, partial [Zea mays]